MARVLEADFETTVGERTNVWLWGGCTLFDHEFEYGYTIEGFISYAHDQDSIIYFHNLKFDGIFLLDWYLKNGYTVDFEKGKQRDKTIPYQI